MTQKERLIELLTGKSIDQEEDVDYVADYLLSNGVIVPPCKVGDTVYRLQYDCADPTDNDCDWDCDHCKYGFLNIHDVLLDGWHDVTTAMESWGEYYFSTREEAEQALKEREKK